MRINIGVNLDTVESGFEIVPEGTYHLRISSCKQATSQSGKPKLQFAYEIIAPAEFAGKKIPDSISLQDQALWKLKALVEAAGISYDEDGFDDDDTIGLEFMAEVGTRMYDNKTVNDITKYMASNEGTPGIKPSST